VNNTNKGKSAFIKSDVSFNYSANKHLKYITN